MGNRKSGMLFVIRQVLLESDLVEAGTLKR